MVSTGQQQSTFSEALENKTLIYSIQSLLGRSTWCCAVQREPNLSSPVGGGGARDEIAVQLQWGLDNNEQIFHPTTIMLNSLVKTNYALTASQLLFSRTMALKQTLRHSQERERCS